MKKAIQIIILLFYTGVSFGQRLATPTLSPASKISQQVGLTEIGVEYARPSAKGREVFGKLVPYGKIWRTGANASTKIILKESVKIGGNSIAAGTYALYTIPGAEKWTIIIHSNIKMRSLAGDVYKPADDVFRFEVKSNKIEPTVETFTIQFTDITTSSVNLQLSWERTTVNIPFSVEVDSKIATQMEEFLKSPETIPHRTYFEAAQYNLHNDLDLDQALKWINAALNTSAENPRYGLLKAKIQAKDGELMDAIETINLAYDWAVKAKNDNYIEQTGLFRTSLVARK